MSRRCQGIAARFGRRNRHLQFPQKGLRRPDILWPVHVHRLLDDMGLKLPAALLQADEKVAEPRAGLFCHRLGHLKNIGRESVKARSNATAPFRNGTQGQDFS